MNKSSFIFFVKLNLQRQTQSKPSPHCNNSSISSSNIIIINSNKQTPKIQIPPFVISSNRRVCLGQRQQHLRHWPNCEFFMFNMSGKMPRPVRVKFEIVFNTCLFNSAEPPKPVAIPDESTAPPAQPQPRLGQPRPGADPAPRPDPDDDHPCGPFAYDHHRKSPPPIRTAQIYSSGGKARFGRFLIRFIPNRSVPFFDYLV